MVVGDHYKVQKGYYERFLDRGNLKDTEMSQRYFNCIFEMTGSEEELEELGDYIVLWKKKVADGWAQLTGESVDSPLEEKD